MAATPAAFSFHVPHIYVCPPGASSPKEPGRGGRRVRAQRSEISATPGDVATATWFLSATPSIPQIVCPRSPERLSGSPPAGASQTRLTARLRSSYTSLLQIQMHFLASTEGGRSQRPERHFS